MTTQPAESITSESLSSEAAPECPRCRDSASDTAKAREAENIAKKELAKAKESLTRKVQTCYLLSNFTSMVSLI